MRPILTRCAALLLAASMGVGAAPAVQGDTYKAKKAECQDRANGRLATHSTFRGGLSTFPKNV